MGRVTASAPGKCILFGEHAVVYGEPAVAVAIEQRISVTLESVKAGETPWKIGGMHFDAKKHPHVQALRNRLWQTSQNAPGLTIQVTGDIPPASGLGSSAALSVAASAALRCARGRWYTSTDDLQNPQTWAEGYASTLEQNDVYTAENREISARQTGSPMSHYVVGKEVASLDESAFTRARC